MPKWLLLLLSSVARAPDGAEGGTPPAAEPTPPAEVPAEPEGNGSLIPETPAEGDATPPAEGTEPKPAPPAEPEAVDLSTLKLPEGMKADDPALAKLVETLSDPKLTPAQRTEALLAQHGETLQAVATAAQQSIHDNYRTINDGWVKEIREDPELGRDKFDQTISTIAKAIDSWSPDAKAMRQALSLTGAGNNPAVIRTLYAMASALGEGKPAQGKPAPTQKSAVDLLYGGNAS